MAKLYPALSYIAYVDMQQEAPPKAQLLADLRQSLYEVKMGQTIPISDFLIALGFEFSFSY
jgi:hypothetical protein